ncbi:FtsH protease activity modulator HflK [Aestuariispira ectoiniformans]|uniref:FtsH protease activity modulator HflK n=1 Tax=Aestuariispira ectoiniformans TaxID=2775080 RepID=UPI00223BA8F5|nr:FtsH protease activity modulator HflK [Aestuariispira ectoiniformans]
MPWQNNSGGGGPWGGGGNRGGGGGNSPWGRGGGGGGGQQPPDMEQMVRESQEKLKKMLPGDFGGKGILVIVLLAVALWFATGFYTVKPGEQGVELVFGKLYDTTGSGLNYNFPAPIGEVLTPSVEAVNQVEVGYRSAGAGRNNVSREISEESLMLTGDENIIDYQFTVFWRIKDAGKFLFNVRNPADAVKNVSEAAMREVIGKSDFEYARTDGRIDVSNQARDLIQQILDSYNAGILITNVNARKVDPPKSVLDAFRDVQAARADKERAINEATAYLNEVTQRAQGQAEQIVRAGEAYKQETIDRADGDASRFLQVYEEYKKAKSLTQRRIYLETMEEILGGMDKVLIENGPDGSAGVLPYLPLNELTGQKKSK